MEINTTKSQLTPASTLSGLNKFKHFLVLSLLITFSFNAFAADNSEQPNKELSKEAYLDLSKPYTHKQSNTTKKDQVFAFGPFLIAGFLFVKLSALL
jgi:hypothetical protein